MRSSCHWGVRTGSPILSQAFHMLILLAAMPAAASTRNLTVYRITPRNYSGVTNMDTGDAAGDAFFGLYELSFPVLCANPGFKRSIGCSNIPILSIPHFNVYSKNRVEADTRYGDYSQCNPNPSSEYLGSEPAGCCSLLTSVCSNLYSGSWSI